MMRQLTCTISSDDFDDKSTTKIQTSGTTQDTTYASTSAPTIKTTKPWIWTSNTIDTGDYGLPTRHRRETEDTMSPISTKSTTEVTSKDKTAKKQTSPKAATTEASFIKTTTEKQHDSPRSKEVDKLRQLTATQAVESTTEDSSKPPEEQAESFATATATSETKISDSTPEDNAEYSGAIGQGQLFSIIDNITMFDIIELNETDDSKANKNSTTTQLPTTRITPLSSTTHASLYTTVIYHKEPPEEPKSVTNRALKKQSKPLSIKNEKTANDLTNQFEDKTISKEIPMYSINSSPMAKLNRTFRKELPMYEVPNQKEINLDVDNNLPEIEPDYTDSRHHTIEIKLHNTKNKNATVSTLFVTTRKLKLSTEQTKPPEMKEIDPKIDILNRNITKNNDSEPVPPTTIIERMEDISSEEIMKQQYLPKSLLVTENPHDNEQEFSDESTTEGIEPVPQAQPRPNRQRQLTRPQRRSFYPYFFSRVLG